MAITLAKARQVGASHIAAISEAELACRLYEAAAYVKRPKDMTAAQALNTLDGEDRARWRAAAVAAMEYWRECVGQMQQTS